MSNETATCWHQEQREHSYYLYLPIALRKWGTPENTVSVQTLTVFSGMPQYVQTLTVFSGLPQYRPPELSRLLSTAVICFSELRLCCSCWEQTTRHTDPPRHAGSRPYICVTVHRCCYSGERAADLEARPYAIWATCVRQNSEKYFFRFYWIFFPYYTFFTVNSIYNMV